MPSTQQTQRQRPPRQRLLDPRAVPALNFHAAQLIWGERRFAMCGQHSRNWTMEYA